MLSPGGGIGALVSSCRAHSVEKPLVGKRQPSTLPGDEGYDGIGPAPWAANLTRVSHGSADARTVSSGSSAWEGQLQSMILSEYASTEMSLHALYMHEVSSLKLGWPEGCGPRAGRTGVSCLGGVRAHCGEGPWGKFGFSPRS